MLTLLKNTQLYAPQKLGKKDLLIAGKKIVVIEDNLDSFINDNVLVIDLKGKIVTP